MIPEPRRSIADCAMGLAQVKPGDVKFVILDGSAAEGSDRRYSDYDVVVVKKGTLKNPGSVVDLFGVFDGRLLSGWLVDEVSFVHRYIGDDDPEFLWRRRQLSKARLLLGNEREFNKVVRRALARRWNRKRQMAVVQYSYVTMIEYLGKMLNKLERRENDTYEFYRDGFVVATQAARLIAALNKIDLDSDKTMYRQIQAEASLKPPNFERDFALASGLANSRRSSGDVTAAAIRLVRWARLTVSDSFKQRRGDDSGFWQIVRDIRF